APLAVFAAAKRYYAAEPIGPHPVSAPAERARQRRALAGLFGIFAVIVFFWVVYEHNDSLWVFFARDHVDRRLPVWLGGAELAPDQFQFVNAALVLVMVPFSQWSWRRVDPRGR